MTNNSLSRAVWRQIQNNNMFASYFSISIFTHSDGHIKVKSCVMDITIYEVAQHSYWSFVPCHVGISNTPVVISGRMMWRLSGDSFPLWKWSDVKKWKLLPVAGLMVMDYAAWKAKFASNYKGILFAGSGCPFPESSRNTCMSELA